MSRRIFIMQRNVTDTGWETKTISGKNTTLTTDFEGGLSLNSNKKAVSGKTGGTLGSSPMLGSVTTLDLSSGSLWLQQDRSTGDSDIVIRLINTGSIDSFNLWYSGNSVEHRLADLWLETSSFNRPDSASYDPNFEAYKCPTGMSFSKSSSFLEFVRQSPGSSKYSLKYIPIASHNVIGTVSF